MNGQLIEDTRGLAEQNAREGLQGARGLRATVFVEQGRGADDDEALGRRQPHRDHVDLDEIPEPYPGIEAFLDDVDRLVLTHKFELDVGVGAKKVGQQTVHQQRQARAWHIDAQPNR